MLPFLILSIVPLTWILPLVASWGVELMPFMNVREMDRPLNTGAGAILVCTLYTVEEDEALM